MYKNIIDIRKDIPERAVNELAALADTAFDNREGKVSNTSDTPYRFVYSGGEPEYSCLEVGMLKLKRQPDFLHCIESWKWIDEEDPDENCDLLSLFTGKAARGA